MSGGRKCEATVSTALSSSPMVTEIITPDNECVDAAVPNISRKERNRKTITDVPATLSHAVQPQRRGKTKIFTVLLNCQMDQ